MSNYFKNKETINPANSETLRAIETPTITLSLLIFPSSLASSLSILVSNLSILLSCSKTTLVDSATSALAFCAKSVGTPAFLRASKRLAEIINSLIIHVINIVQKIAFSKKEQSHD